MAVFTRTTKNLIIRIDEFFDNIDLGLLVFREALKAYLDKDFEAFERHLNKVDGLENSADRLQREIENEMITHSVLPQQREEVVKLIDVLDEIIDSVKSSLIEIEHISELLIQCVKNCYGSIILNQKQMTWLSV
ncbi:MAG: DUF47 family protein [Bacteroidia bacterium]|nr:DUF47 family protein [Bacteroidia bacterium]